MPMYTIESVDMFVSVENHLMKQIKDLFHAISIFRRFGINHSFFIVSPLCLLTCTA